MKATVTVTVPRALLLSANGREHWSKRARATRLLRALAAHAWTASGRPRFDTARIDVHITHPDRRRRDTANLHPTVKACLDGLVEVGLLPDDDDTHLTGPHLWPTTETTRNTTTRLDFHIEGDPHA